MRLSRLKSHGEIAFTALLLAASLSSCSALRRSGPAPNEPDTIVEVENHGFPDVVMYAVAAGDPYRLGMVTGSSSAKFKLPPRFTSVGSVQLLARPIAGRAYLLPAVSVSPGDLILVSLENSAAQSHVSVAPR